MGAQLQVQGRQGSGWGRSLAVASEGAGRSAEFLGTWAGGDLPPSRAGDEQSGGTRRPGGNAGQRRGLRGCGGSRAGGVTRGGGGGAAIAAATRPPGPGRSQPPAAGQALRADTLQTMLRDARRGSGPLGHRRRSCGTAAPQVSPPLSLQIPPLFVWRTWRPRGFRRVSVVAGRTSPYWRPPG